MEDDEPIFFDNDHSDIKFYKDLIKEQGLLTCRDELDITCIKKCLSDFDYGFILFGNKAKIGQYSKSRVHSHLLKAYALFKHDDNLKLIEMKIICSSLNYKGSGLKILNAIYSFILSNKVETWIIYSLPPIKLINYYKSFGFEDIQTIYAGGKEKVHLMIKKIEYDIIKSNNQFCGLDTCINLNNVDDVNENNGV